MARKPAGIPEKTLGEAPDTAPKHPITRLDDVIGQSQAKGTIEAALSSGRVHHAWIFHGPQGIGKLTTAVAFAAAVLDPTLSPDLSGHLAPEDGSTVQTLVRAGTHPDLHIINKELAAVSREAKTRDSKQITLAKDVVDEFLIEPAQRSCVMKSAGSLVSKVFIIDEAELMNIATQNALLKTLEEPPEGTLIILVTSSEDRLLATIRSRSQRVGFVPLSDQDMADWLRASGQGVSPDHAKVLLEMAQGSPGAATLIMDHELLAWKSTLSPLLEQAFTGSFAPELGGVMAKLVSERAEAAVKENADASKDAANKAWARRMLSFIAEDARRRLRKQPGDRAVAAKSLIVLDAVQAAEGHLASNVNLTLALENLAAQMAVEPTSLSV